ncbi:ABC transporter permease [Nocardioides bruguierae]|uniref:ABC transporter permease n=1 Tax=Nocardioides bruguierae TaxID=2945102 RepID=A0A9X2IE03_9ACTN|nr:ABC transporter permease [Nocardioides bruguierae]MCM0620316.1 ABC transporter permease [Nocardioides bruguierae]
MTAALTDWLPFVAGLAVLALATVGVAAWAGVGLGWLPVRSLLRAGVQLTAVALLLAGVLANPWTVVAFVALMLSTASWTSAGRLRALHHGRRTAAAGVLAGATVAVGSVLVLSPVTGLVPHGVRYVIAVAGILVGNAMTAATLSGRSFLRAARVRAAEVEGWLAMGATPSQAHAAIGRESVRESLLPTLDQTRATGLVTLPGAFVGALFGGASPADAARFQLVVLAGIALTAVVTAVVVTRLAGRSPLLVPVEPSAG